MSQRAREAAEAVLQAANAGDVAALAKRIHPDSLRDMQHEHAELLASAEKSAERHPRTRPDFERLLSIYGAASADQIRAMPPDEFLARVIRRSSAAAGVSYHLVDVVMEEDRFAHVLFRVSYSGRPYRSVQTATLRSQGDEWYLLVDPWSHWILPGLENQVLADEFAP